LINTWLYKQVISVRFDFYSVCVI